MKTHLLLKRLLLVWVFAFSASLWGQTTVTHTFAGTSGVIDSNISYSTERNSGSNAPAFNTELRLYYSNASPYNGCSITLTPASGVTITAVELTGVTSYLPTVRYTIGTGTPTISDPQLTRIGTSVVYNVSGLSISSSMKIRNANTTNTQGRFTGIKVTYTEAATVPAVTGGTVSTSYGSTMTDYQIAATGAPTSYAVATGTLPAGLSLNNTTGIISGTPTVSGNSSITVTATNANGTSAPATLNFEIAKKALTVTGLTANNKTYDASNDATLNTSSMTLNGVLAGDVGNVSLDGIPTGTFANANVGVAKAVTVTGLSISGTKAGNYTLTQPIGLTAAISQKTITATGVTAANKVYNGTTVATVSGGTLTGVEAADTANVSISTTGTFASANVGTGIAVTVALTGSAAANYSLTQPTVIADITIASQSITFNTIPTLNLGGANINLNTYASASSGLALTYVSSNPAVVSVTENTLTIVGVGTATITASQAGDSNHLSAADALQNVTVTLTPISIFKNPITGSSPNNSNPYTSGQTFNPNITVGGISRGDGILGANANDRYNTTGYNTASTTVVSDEYFEFILTPNAGYKIDFDKFNFTLQRSNSGPSSFAVRSSLDNFTTDLAVYTYATASSFQENLMLGAAFDNVTTEITFRIYGYNAGTGTASVNDFDFTGNVLAIPSTIWTGTWSNGDPDSTKNAIIDADYNGDSFESKSLTVNAGKTLTVKTSVTTGNVTNNGTIIVNDNANFIQNGIASYSGDGIFTVKRNSVSPAGKYAFWSSPVVGQNMYGIFATAPAAVMIYNTETNYYDTVGNAIAGYTGASGVGYSIKAPTAGPTATFVGVPHNGEVTVSLSTAADKYNLIGNPYPSNLDLTKFYTKNTGKIGSTLWFWDYTGGTVTSQNGSTASNFGYATFNASGTGTWLKAPNGSKVPSGIYAKVGQGFIVEAVGTSGSSVTFQNDQRAAAVGVDFNKGTTANQNEGKYWLTLSTSYNANVTQAITYQDGASNHFDSYDSQAIGLGSDAFYSLASAEKVVIQGKALFNTNDVVVLGNKHFEAGNFKIELTQKEGLFADGQAIYLRDKLLGTETNLQEGAYLFTSNGGEYSDRFEVVYERGVLATNSAAKNTLAVYRNGDDFVIDSPSKISSVEVYDASGKLIKSIKSNVNKETVSNLSRGVFILKVTTATETVSKKVIK